jgi:hypothetical protein
MVFSLFFPILTDFFLFLTDFFVFFSGKTHRNMTKRRLCNVINATKNILQSVPRSANTFQFSPSSHCKIKRVVAFYGGYDRVLQILFEYFPSGFPQIYFNWIVLRLVGGEFEIAIIILVVYQIVTAFSILLL